MNMKRIDRRTMLKGGALAVPRLYLSVHDTPLILPYNGCGLRKASGQQLAIAEWRTIP